jgi:hypothetical protein
MNKESIIEEIIDKVGSSRICIWIIGITGQPEEVRQKYEDSGIRTTCWSAWKSESGEDIKEIEKFFLVQGMQQGAKSDGDGNYLYVF